LNLTAHLLNSQVLIHTRPRLLPVLFHSQGPTHRNRLLPVLVISLIPTHNRLLFHSHGPICSKLLPVLVQSHAHIYLLNSQVLIHTRLRMPPALFHSQGPAHRRRLLPVLFISLIPTTKLFLALFHSDAPTHSRLLLAPLARLPDTVTA